MVRRVVVTGMGAVSPLGNDVETSFSRLKVFENCVQALPELTEYKGLNTCLGCCTEFERPAMALIAAFAPVTNACESRLPIIVSVTVPP